MTTAYLLSSRARDSLCQTKKHKEHATWSGVCSRCTTSPTWVPRSLPPYLNMGMLYRDCSYQPIYWKLGRDEICRRVSHGTRSNQQSFMFLPSALSKTLWLSTHICPTSTIFPYSNELRSFPCLEYLSGDLDTERTQRLLHGARKASFPIYVLGRPLRSNITSFDGM